MSTASSTRVRARRTSDVARVAVTSVTPYSTSAFAESSSRSAFSAVAASGRLPRACLSSFAAVAWSLPLLVEPVSAETMASLELMPAWMALPAAGV